jgi:hypothetical protein
MEVKTKNNLNVQIETIKNEKKSKNFACANFFKTPPHIKHLCFFLCVNDNQNVHIEHAQIIFYILCYNGPINASNPRTQV